MNVSRISEVGLDLIKAYEKLKLVAYYATPDEKARGICTIGWGHIKGVKPGDVCTEEEAKAYLVEDCAEAEQAVYGLVRVPLNQNQYDALVSLVFNIGSGNFASSTLLRKLNQEDYAGAAAEFPRWNKQSGKVLNGLTKRRAIEQALFNKPVE